jgi:hypothetical protein
MDVQTAFSRTEDLMQRQYGISIVDCFNEDEVRQWLADGDEPQAIVDEAGDKLELVRRPNSLAECHLESLVIYWRELMEQIMGKGYADQVTDESISGWLLFGKEPKRPENEDERDEMMDSLTRYIEDNL